MATRRLMVKRAPPRPELERLVEESKKRPLTEEELQEQRISFIYGNAPMDSRRTKEEVRRRAGRISLRDPDETKQD